MVSVGLGGPIQAVATGMLPHSLLTPLWCKSLTCGLGVLEEADVRVPLAATVQSGPVWHSSP